MIRAIDVIIKYLFENKDIVLKGVLFEVIYLIL